MGIGEGRKSSIGICGEGMKSGIGIGGGGAIMGMSESSLFLINRAGGVYGIGIGGGAMTFTLRHISSSHTITPGPEQSLSELHLAPSVLLTLGGGGGGTSIIRGGGGAITGGNCL
jgi:hypothetical protein